MENWKAKLFYISIGLIPIGLLFRFQNLPFGSLIFMFGLVGIIIYFIENTIIEYRNNRTERLNLILKILIVLMSIVLFTKYLYHRFGDYPGLLIVPTFILTSIFYLIIGKSKNTQLTIISILYLLLTIPLFGFEYNASPRKYIPQEWYNRFDIRGNKSVKIPFSFEKKETEELNAKARELTRSNQYYDAIISYRTAIKIEPQNPILYFNLSECYALTNDLESAIVLLDTAIMLNNQIAPFYNNRGLLYYKLKQNDLAIRDYEFSIKLDSTNSISYYNLALAFYYQKRYKEACQSLDKAEQLGLDVSDYMIKEIKFKCE